MKTKQIYDRACSTAESLLGLDSVLSVQEIAVRLGFGHLVAQVVSSLILASNRIDLIMTIKYRPPLC